MTERRSRRGGWRGYACVVATGIGLLAAADGCGSARRPSPERFTVVLRVGAAASGLAANPQAGFSQLVQLLSVESLAQPTDDGRFGPGLAEQWTLTNNNRSLIVKLKSGVTFHDGSPVNAQTVAAALSDALRSTELSSLQDDVDHIGAASADSVEIDFRRPSPLLLDLLGVQFKKPGEAIVGTGPFMVDAQSTTLLKANPHYHLGHPSIDEVRIEQFPSVRTAWAELLRDRIDMLHEVPLDALDSLESSTNVAVFKFTRPYQLMLVFNTQSSALRPAAVRRALNISIDRAQLVRQALNQHGLPSTSPVKPGHWAVQGAAPPTRFDPQLAARALGPAHVRFTCLIVPDQVYERIALELKRQLAIVGVDMDVQAVPVDEMFAAVGRRRYDAILFDGISGPPLLRVYSLWHSRGTLNPGTFGNPAVDAALDRVRHAETEADYREAVARLQQTFADDPPAVFLAWSERARAVSKRFVVPVQPDREILGTLWLWKPANGERRASRN